MTPKAVHSPPNRGNSRSSFTAAVFVLFGAPHLEAQEDKYGVLAKRFLSLSNREKVLYAAGVVDGLDAAGIRCPGKASYGEIIARTEAIIWKLYPDSENLWAATAMVLALGEMGCKKP